MVTDFQDRLRQIREQRDRETRAKQEVEAAANQERRSAIEERFDRREKIEAVIDALAAKFIHEVGAFSRSKSFFEGKYKIEVGHEDLLVDEQGHPQKLFSRLAFLIDTTTPESIRVAVKKTVRNRDQESVQTEVGATPEAVAEFEQFSENQFFGFADLYFAGQSATAR